ncbi:MAG TPA: hypothetical protein VMH33_14005 [Solirubrobacterales bacterium]|nr:hypothetical protein [Solirubrobacterales bacterium]
MRFALLTGLIAIIALLVVPSLASAALPAHPFTEIFSAKDAHEPTLTTPTHIALNQSDGDLYVIEKSVEAVSRWTPEGTPDNFTAGPDAGTNQLTGITFEGPNENQIAVDSSNGKIYVVSLAEEAVDIFNADGSSAGQLNASSGGPFGEPCGVAVNSTGHVYVADASNHTIDKFGNPPVSGTTEEEIPVTGEEPCNIAVGAGPSAGYVFAAGYTEGVFKVKTGSPQQEIYSGSVSDLSVDPGTGHLYLAPAGSTEVKEYNVSGATAEEVSSTPTPNAVYGTAVNWASGDLYVARAAGSHLEVYGPGPGGSPLTVEVEGNGEGTVTSNPAGIDCGSAGSECEHTYEEELVTLTGAAEGGHTEPVEWVSGCDTVNGSDECEVTMSEAKTVKAKFSLKTHALGVTVEGSGSVECKEGAGSFGPCTGPFDEGAQVTVKDIPAAHWHFAEFKAGSGSATSCDGVTATECTFTIEADSTLTAVNAKTMHALSITSGGAGAGEVACEVNGGERTDEPCAPEYQDGTQLKLLPVPDEGAAFVEFENAGGAASACEGTATCEFTLSGDASVEARFEPIAHPAILLVFKGGNRKGSVRSLAPDSQIECGTRCDGEYEEGQTVELEAVPQAGSILAGWIGCRQGTGTTCTVTLKTEEVEVTAIFVPVPVITEFDGSHEPLAEPCHGNGGTSTEYEGVTTYTCNGKIGKDGEPGKTPTVTSFSGSGEPGGQPCSGRGGVDIALEGAHTYVCNGEKGANGSNGLTPTVTALSVGNAHCASGGVEIKVGTEPATYVCNGEKGANGAAGKNIVVHTFTGEKTVGSVTCKAGGVEAEVEGEASTRQIVCNGEKGERGQIGLSGPEGTTGATGATGQTGATGATGAQGSTGATGAIGPEGKQGKEGKRGPAGMNAKVTCKVQGSKKVKCTVEYPKGSSQSRRLRWSLHRAGHTVSHGNTTQRRLNRVLGNLDPGTYVLDLAGHGTRLVIPSWGRGNG